MPGPAWRVPVLIAMAGVGLIAGIWSPSLPGAVAPVVTLAHTATVCGGGGQPGPGRRQCGGCFRRRLFAVRRFV